MSDDTIDDARPSEPTCPVIRLDDEAAVAAWCTRFGVTEERLHDAVRLVGVMPTAVEFLIRSRGSRVKKITAADHIKYEMLRENRRAKRKLKRR